MAEALLILGMLAAAAWFWADSLAAREAALGRSHQVCAEMHVQMLDETIVLTRLWATRDVRGRIVLQRQYHFEFSAQGSDRRAGLAQVRGVSVDWVRLDLPGGSVISGSGHLHRVQ